MRAMAWKWATLIGAGSAAVIVYREVRQRAELLRQMMADDRCLDEALEDSFPASDPVSRSPLAGTKVAR